MNRKIMFFSMFLFIALSGCNKDEATSEELELDKHNFAFDSKDDGGILKVVSNTNWELTWTEPWVKCTPASGVGSRTVTVSVDRNTMPDTRTTTINVSTEKGVVSKQVTVTQGGTDPYIIIVPETQNIAPAGERILVSVASSADWTVDIPAGVSWISVDTKSTSRAYLNADANRDEDRSADIVFSLTGSDKQAAITLLQDALQLPRVTQLPEEGIIGKDITITGSNFTMIEEVWLGNAKGTIGSGRTDVSLTIRISAVAEEGHTELKLVYDGGNELSTGLSTNLILVDPEFELPAEGWIGETMRLSGIHLTLIDEVWFNDVRGSIASGRTDLVISVNIPTGLLRGPADVKVVYLATKEMQPGTIDLMANGPNLALYAGSSLPDVPALIQTRPRYNFNVASGRCLVFAFDGVRVAADFNPLVDYVALYGGRIPGEESTNLATLTPGVTAWFVNNSGDIFGEIGDGPLPSNRACFVLDYSGTTAGSVTFDRMMIVPRQPGTDFTKYTIEISDDNNTWTKVIKAEDTQAIPSNSVPVSHLLDEAVTAKYVRFVMVERGAADAGVRSFELYNTRGSD